MFDSVLGKTYVSKLFYTLSKLKKSYYSFTMQYVQSIIFYFFKKTQQLN